MANDRPVRIGVNWGSLDQDLLTEMMDANATAAEPRDARDVYIDAMLESALRSAALAEEVGLRHDQIVISAKVSQVQDLVETYRRLASRCDYPLHLGLTEAGLGSKGIIASTAGLSILLAEGIGDTIRVSLTPKPNGDRTEEVQVAQQILQSLGLRSFTPQVTSCPGCGRTTSTFFQHMAEDIQTYLREQMPVWRATRPGVEEMKVAVMGCVVNGPGESKHANIGISLPGTFEEPKAPVYVDGKLMTTLRGDRIVEEFLVILEDYVARRYESGTGDGGRETGLAAPFYLATRPLMAVIDGIFLPGGRLEKPVLNLKLPAHYLDEARYEEALKEYRQILKHYPDETEAYEKSIWLEAAVFKRPAAARALLKRAKRRRLVLDPMMVSLAEARERGE